MATVQAIPLSKIVPGKNPREEMGDIAGLAESIRDRGLLQPIRVKRAKTGLFQIITGHRRYEAHRHLRKATIDAIVVDEEDESESALDRIVENLQREDLRPLELAKGIEALSRSFKKSDAEIAASLGKTATVIKQWRLLSRLPDEILERVGTAESVSSGDVSVTPRHLTRILPHIPEPDAADPSSRRQRDEKLSLIGEFIQSVENHGGINAHQADAAWSMVLKGETSPEEAVEEVAKDPDAYRYKRSFEERPLPPPIESGENLEEETYRYFLNLASIVRSRLSDARPPIIRRLSPSHRQELVRTWEPLEKMISDIVMALRTGAARPVKPKALNAGG